MLFFYSHFAASEHHKHDIVTLWSCYGVYVNQQLPVYSFFMQA